MPHPTMATDGAKIVWHREFVDQLTVPFLNFVLCHEIIHIILNHVERQGQRDPQVWGWAIDFADNAILKKQESSWLKMPDGDLKGLYDQKYGDDRAELIYDDLIKNKPPQQLKTIDFHLSGPGGKNKKGKKGLKAAQMSEELKELWKSRVYAAREHAKRQGSSPAGLEVFLDNLTKPQVNWRTILHNFVNEQSRDDYTWSRPSRMHLHRGLVLPSCYSEEIGTVVVAIDTSGSISTEQLQQFMSEIQAIKNSYPVTVRVIICDAAVHGDYTLERYGSFDHKKIKIQGRGGTDFKPVFKYVDDNKIRPTMGIYLTDGYGDFPNHPPAYPFLWVLTKTNKTPPWGRNVVINV